MLACRKCSAYQTCMRAPRCGSPPVPGDRRTAPAQSHGVLGVRRSVRVEEDVGRFLRSGPLQGPAAKSASGGWPSFTVAHAEGGHPARGIARTVTIARNRLRRRGSHQSEDPRRRRRGRRPAGGRGGEDHLGAERAPRCRSPRARCSTHSSKGAQDEQQGCEVHAATARPWLDGTPVIRGSIATAARRARATALNWPRRCGADRGRRGRGCAGRVDRARRGLEHVRGEHGRVVPPDHGAVMSSGSPVCTKYGRPRGRRRPPAPRPSGSSRRRSGCPPCRPAPGERLAQAMATSSTVWWVSMCRSPSCAEVEAAVLARRSSMWS